MFKAILVAVLFGGLGVGIGVLQASMSYNASEERFTSSRPPLSVRKRETTEKEILQATQANGQPKLEILGEDEYDFGSMMHGDEMSHSFRFRNGGDGPLVLEMGDSSCKCTVGDLDKSILQPGEETDVTLTWKAFSVTYDFGQYAMIKTNDVDNIDVKLSVFGQITEAVTVVPRTIKLDTISDTEVTERKVMVMSIQRISLTCSKSHGRTRRPRGSSSCNIAKCRRPRSQIPVTRMPFGLSN